MCIKSDWHISRKAPSRHMKVVILKHFVWSLFRKLRKDEQLEWSPSTVHDSSASDLEI